MLKKDRLGIFGLVSLRLAMRISLLCLLTAGADFLVRGAFSATTEITRQQITKIATKGRKIESEPKPAPDFVSIDALMNSLSVTLLDQLQAWVKTANFWKLVERGERLSARLEVLSVKSNALEAWVCGQTKVCISSRLLREFPPEAQQAVVAHELGHLLIPRNYDAHPQLWEAQCDLFAVAFLRDAEQMKQMLKHLSNDCANCQDREHPVPKARAALIECNATTPLNEALKFDEFRQRSFAVHFRGKLRSVPSGLQHLNFALKSALTNSEHFAEIKALNFAIRFNPSIRDIKLLP